MTIRAAARGVVDFRAARPRDVTWWRRTNVLIEAMARDDDLRLTEALLHKDCAYVANGWLEESSFKEAQERAHQRCLRLMDQLRPWATAASAQTDVLDSALEAWKAAYGDPSDPAVMKKIEEGIKKHREEQDRAVAETDEQRVARKIREKYARRK